jgi:hypothetical protein
MLGIVGSVAGILALTGAGGPVLSVLAVVGFLALAGGIFANSRIRQLQEAIPQIAATAKATPAARAAAQRARRLSNYAPDELITDVAIIVNDRDRNGRLQRRIGNTVSMDDYAVQPIVKFTVPPGLVNRVSIIKFEIVDKAGKTQFARSVEHYTRDGENLVACDQQLPFRNNTALGRAGTWDLQVTINGQLAAVHSFTVTPAQQDRTIPVTHDGEINISRLQEPIEEEESDMPMSLEDLLREQRRSQ